MDSQYKLISIAFSLQTAIDPFRIIRNIERYFKKKGCVKSIKSFYNDVIVVTLCSDRVVSKVKELDCILIEKKFYNYKIVEINITSVRIEVPPGIGTDDINRLLRSYGNIMENKIVSCRGTTGAKLDTNVYYGIIEMKRDIPSKIKCKCGYLSVVEVL